MKTSDLIGPALDWAVECAERGFFVDPDDFVMRTADESYINNWHQGGPIIERERIELKENGYGYWFARIGIQKWVRGPTPLIAAMLCYVASQLGDKIEIPEELK